MSSVAGNRIDAKVSVGDRAMITLKQDWAGRLLILPVRTPGWAADFHIFVDHHSCGMSHWIRFGLVLRKELPHGFLYCRKTC